MTSAIAENQLATVPASPPKVGGPRGMSVVASAKLLHRLMFDPIGLIDDLRAEHGELFTVPIPFGITPPFTFLTTREGYSTVLNLSPEVGRNGPIIDRVPALARWSPRSNYSDDHLQDLLLTGRKFIGTRLRSRKGSELKSAIRLVIEKHIAEWEGEVDIASLFVSAIHEASARLLLGDELWNALGKDALALVRTVVNAVDAARAATALSPAAIFLPEYRATKTLGKRLLRIARDPQTDRFDFVQGLRKVRGEDKEVPPEDVAWMMFFAVWNATLYTGTYGVWSYLDIISRPEVLAAVRDDSTERGQLIEGAIVETMRMNPISWQLRSLATAVTVECEGRTYEVPEGHFLSVFSHGLNRDGDVYPEPLQWNPRRYIDGAPPPLLFGHGPFSCVAQFWVKVLIGTVHAQLLDALNVELLGPLPQKISRVHLLYPQGKVLAKVSKRTKPEDPGDSL